MDNPEKLATRQGKPKIQDNMCWTPLYGNKNK